MTNTALAYGKRNMDQGLAQRVIRYIWLGYSTARIVQLFDVREKAVTRLKRRFG